MVVNSSKQEGVNCVYISAGCGDDGACNSSFLGQVRIDVCIEQPDFQDQAECASFRRRGRLLQKRPLTVDV
jgi:hypothetical protein